MAGLAAAWALTDPSPDSAVESVTVYQRGWRLGGKGASSRGRHGRIEEHGLHVWLGYYANAFGLLREVYEELDRLSPLRAARSRHSGTPACPPGGSASPRTTTDAGHRGWPRSPAMPPSRTAEHRR